MSEILVYLGLEQQATMFSYKKQLGPGNEAGKLSAVSS